MEDNTIEAEIIEDDFKAPILQDIKYPVTEDALQAIVAKYADIPNIDLEANEEEVGEQYQFVLAGHKLLVKERNKIEKTRKAIKDPAYTFGKNVDAFAKKLQSIIKETEDKLKFQRDRVEQNEARKQREAEEAEEQRVTNIERIINQYKNYPMECVGKSSKVVQEVIDLAELPKQELLEEFFDEALAVYDNSMETMRSILGGAIAVENAEKIQAERDAEAKAKQDEEDAKLKEEKDKLAKEKADFEKEQAEFNAYKKSVHDEAERKKAEEEADKLQEKQEKDMAEKKKKDYIDRELSIQTTLQAMSKYTDDGLLLNEIIRGAIPNVRWVQDGN